ncbi:hypothetical protein [Nocardia africana]
MGVVVVILLLVASVRLSIWDRKTRDYTIALFVLAVSFALSMNSIGERYVDPTLRGVFGDNVSDVAHTCLTVVTAWLIGLMWIRMLWWEPGRRGLIPKRWTWFARAWSWFSFVCVAGMVVLSRVGRLGSVAADDDFAMHDPASLAYMSITLLFTMAACLLFAAGGIAQVRIRRWDARTVLWSIGVIGVAGVVWVGWMVWAIVVSPQILAGHSALVTEVFRIPVGLALAMVGGVPVVKKAVVWWRRGGVRALRVAWYRRRLARQEL